MAVEAAKQVWWSKAWPLHLGVCGCAAFFVLVFGNPLEIQELRWFGQCLRWRFAAGLAPPVEKSIVHLNIDQQDLKSLPSIETEYATAARIIREASALGARTIAFDIVFSRANPEMAKPLLDAISEHTNVVFAEAFNAEPGEAEPSILVRSLPFRNASPTSDGLINLSADSDGIIRYYDLVHRTKDSFEPSLAFVAYLDSVGLNWKRDVSFPTADTAEWQEISPTDFVTMVPRHVPIGPVLLNFRCPWSIESGPSAFDYLNLRQLDQLFTTTAGGANSRPLANKIVFVGYVAIGQGDLGATVFGAHEPLVYLHSTALNDLIQSRSLARTSRGADALWLLSALVVVAGGQLCRTKTMLVVWWLVGALIVLVAAGVALLWLNLVPPAIATVSLWTVSLVLEVSRRHTNELIERQRLRNTMGLYFSPHVLKSVLENPGRLDPKRVEITVLLTDLRNSTALAEQLGTERMLDLLNQIFAIENGAVFAEDGSLEKPVGDQFLAYWGAPDPQPNAADRGLRAALNLIEGMHKLSETFDANVKSLFGYGLALHAGESLIANIGSAQFFHYGVIGDLINATARVESLTKYYGVQALATREVYQRFTERPESRFIDRVIVKGKSTLLELFELQHKFSPESFKQIAKEYSDAFGIYERGEFAKAERLFRAISDFDQPSSVLAQRCAALAADPPQDWAGVFIMGTK